MGETALFIYFKSTNQLVDKILIRLRMICVEDSPIVRLTPKGVDEVAPEQPPVHEADEGLSRELYRRLL